MNLLANLSFLLFTDSKSLLLGQASPGGGAIGGVFTDLIINGAHSTEGNYAKIPFF